MTQYSLLRTMPLTYNFHTSHICSWKVSICNETWIQYYWRKLILNFCWCVSHWTCFIWNIFNFDLIYNKFAESLLLAPEIWEVIMKIMNLNWTLKASFPTQDDTALHFAKGEYVTIYICVLVITKYLIFQRSFNFKFILIHFNLSVLLKLIQLKIHIFTIQFLNNKLSN